MYHVLVFLLSALLRLIFTHSFYASSKNAPCMAIPWRKLQRTGFESCMREDVFVFTFNFCEAAVSVGRKLENYLLHILHLITMRVFVFAPDKL